MAWSATGYPGSCDPCEVVDALLYQNRTGCQGWLLPHDLPAGRRCSATSRRGARMALTSGARGSCASRCASGPGE
ncbi:transposase [Streptomyces sp. NPDC016675]|uniref:transposase n=1 Tax=Streptomyces sp. NPDC016675 TaxID=3364970 RepID=UPI003700E4B4